MPHKQVTSFLCVPIQVSDSQFVLTRIRDSSARESEVRTDRNDVGADRAGAARTFVDAVIACDRLARTVVGGSVERVVEEVIERGAPIPQHAQHLRVLVRDASLRPSRYRECYAREGGAGTKRASRRGDKSARTHADRLCRSG